MPIVNRLALTASLACVAMPFAETTRSSAIFTQHASTWFEDIPKVGDVSPDGRWLVYGMPGSRRLIELKTGRDAEDRFRRGLDSVKDAVFRPDGTIVRRGSRNGNVGWFAGEGPVVTLVKIPDDATPRWSSDGRVAFMRPAEWSVLRVGEEGAATAHDFGKRIVGFAWMPDARAILVLAREADGGSTLHSLDAATGATRVVATGLDTSAWFPGPAPMPTGRSAIVALASTGPPDAEARHRPDSDRDQDLYSIDLQTGQLKPLVVSPGDDFAPVIASGVLHWTRNEIRDSVVVVPIAGGEPRVVAEAGELPSWHPSGRRLSYMVGDWRLVDIPMNLDAVVVDIDERADVRGSARPLIVGYHEDFPPAWSPDGRWMAYHSHRSATPIPFHNAPGTSDDIYLRRADDPKGGEIRLTDFGREVGTPSWSADGRRLFFASQDPAAHGAVSPWILTIDPDTGRRERAEKWRVPERIQKFRGIQWAPSGEEAAVEAEGVSRDSRELWIASADGTKAERIATFKSTTHGGIDWTPDARMLVYSALAGDRLQLFAVARTGGTPRQLTFGRDNILHPQVSPDGRWIAATRLRVTKSIMRSVLKTR